VNQTAVPPDSEQLARNLGASVFVSGLFALAYSQMLMTFRLAVPSLSPTPSQLVLPFVFVLTSARFLIGNAFYLVRSGSVDYRFWAVDVSVVFVQSFILILLGSTASVEASRMASVGFVQFFVSLHAFAILSILLAFVEHRAKKLHWCWLGINAWVTVSILLLWAWRVDFYSATGLAVVLAISLVAFAADTICTLILHGK